MNEHRHGRGVQIRWDTARKLLNMRKTGMTRLSVLCDALCLITVFEVRGSWKHHQLSREAKNASKRKLDRCGLYFFKGAAKAQKSER